MLTIRPVSLKDANKFIIGKHRHHDKVQGHKFSVACYSGDKLVGVGCAGRPVSRMLDNGLTIEVTRVCSDGTYNACSMIYSSLARASKALGYKKIITYILFNELGTSLKASGWICEDDDCGGNTWAGGHKESGGREDTVNTLFGVVCKYPIGTKKQRWSKIL